MKINIIFNIRKFSFTSILNKNLFFTLFLINFFTHNLVFPYYILPFKYFRTPLSELYQIHSNISQDEVFLNYTNSISLYTSLKINDSLIVQAFLQSKEICSTFSDAPCVLESDSNNNFPNNHINTNISNIFDKMKENSEITLNNQKCINGIIGFGIPESFLSSTCISFVDQTKKNDDTINTYTWSINYHPSPQKNNNYDGEIIIGIEPHEYQPSIYNELNYKSVYNYEDKDYYYLQGNEYTIKFDSIYFYKNNNVSSENKVTSLVPNGKDGYFRFNNRMIQCSDDYFYFIQKYFFNNYTDSKVCEEIKFSQYYHTFVCNKSEIDIEIFYKKFPTLYFKNNQLEYIFELTYKDLFKEENNKIYFMIFYSSLNTVKWSLGEIFLKKYFFTFNQDKKLIGFYINKTINENEENNNNNNNQKSYTGLILLIIGIILLVVEAVIAGVCIYKKCYLNRRKRANELKDDNYDYLKDNSNNKEVINDN